MPHIAQEGAAPRLIPDKIMAPLIGVSVAYLQKDRREGQRIPFVRIGDRCLYDPDEVFEALKAYRVGGPRRLIVAKVGNKPLVTQDRGREWLKAREVASVAPSRNPNGKRKPASEIA